MYLDCTSHLCNMATTAQQSFIFKVRTNETKEALMWVRRLHRDGTGHH